MVTHTLRETVYIDYDKIEASTASNCDGGATMLTPELMELTQDDRPAEGVSARSQHDLNFIMEHEEPREHMHGRDRPSLNVGNEADKMLEQAEALSMYTNLEDLLDFSCSD
jgi:hypothetical protein